MPIVLFLGVLLPRGVALSGLSLAALPEKMEILINKKKKTQQVGISLLLCKWDTLFLDLTKPVLFLAKINNICFVIILMIGNLCYTVRKFIQGHKVNSSTRVYL